MQDEQWEAETVWLQPDKTCRYTVRQNGAVLTYRQTVLLWRESAEFCSYFNNLLAQSTFTAFRWETPCVTEKTIDQPFEFVLVNNPSLDRPVDLIAFDNQFRNATGASVISFANLSGRSTMIVPTPPDKNAPVAAFGHLAAFVRNGTRGQQRALWLTTGEAMHQQISQQPLWLSTAGAGVSWLHIRLDPSPKYYHHRPYRTTPSDVT